MAQIRAFLSKNTHLRKLFLSVCAVSLVLVGFIGVLISLLSMHILEENSMQSNHKQLLLFNNSINAAMRQTETMLVEFASDLRTREFLHYYDSMDIDSLNIVATKFQNLLAHNFYMKSMVLYFPGPQRVYVINSGVVPLAEYYDRAFLEGLNLEAFPEWSWSEPRQLGDGLSHPTEVISLARPIKYGSGGVEAIVVMHMRTSIMTDMFDSVSLGDFTTYFALDAGGTYIAGSTPSVQFLPHLEEIYQQITPSDYGSGYLHIASQQYLASHLTCGANGWIYISLTPEDVIFGGTNKLIYLAVASIFAGIVLAILLSGLVSRKLAAPVIRLAQNLNLPNDSLDLLRHIEIGIQSLKARNENIEKALDESMPILRNNFLAGVLTGILTDPEKISDHLDYYGLEIPTGAALCVYALQIDDVDPATDQRYSARQLNTFTIYLSRLLEGMLAKEGHFLICNIRDDEIALIALWPGLNLEAAREQSVFAAQLIERIVSDEKKHIAAIGVGEVALSFAHAGASYFSAQRALAHRFLYRESPVIFASELGELEGSATDYPFQEEEKLIAAMRHGRLDQAKDCIAAMLLPLNASAGRKHRAIYLLQLMGAILKYCSECGALSAIGYRTAGLYEEILSQPDLSAAEDWFTGLLDKIHSHNITSREKPDRQLSDRIIAYINDNYHKDLSLKQLSAIFYLNGSYLSRIFHEETGYTLKQYITKIRMEAACRLLLDTTLKIGDIGKMVGYEKVHGFLKQFKEVMGTTPTSYREAAVYPAPGDGISAPVSQKAEDRE